jgi:hypothetical protein
MFNTLLSVILVRGSESGAGSLLQSLKGTGPQFLKGSGASSASLPSPIAMPINVAATLFAVDHVRVFVVTSTPRAYFSKMTSPLWTTRRSGCGARVL